MTDDTKNLCQDGKPAPTIVRVEPASGTFGIPATIWLSSSYASEWFGDALNEARTTDNHHGRRREILLAVCAAESYLFEWVRDEVLKRDYERLNIYFPPINSRRIRDRWKEVLKQLHADNLIGGVPSFGEQYWDDFTTLVEYRNGLVHASASRPMTELQPLNHAPRPSKKILNTLSAGWAVSIIVELIATLHKAVGTSPPAWLEKP